MAAFTPTALERISEDEFTRFRELILAHTGISLRDTKRTLLVARLQRRLNELNLASFGEYYDLLRFHDSSGAELRRMINCITTNKTSFFREPEHFDFLKQEIQSRARTSSGGVFRIWSAACSTGEEPYSIAIAALEALRTTPGWTLRILASDIDTEVLEHAEAGTYSAAAVSELPEPLIRRHFLRGTGANHGLVQVKPELRRTIEFRRINLAGNQPPCHAAFDFIFCRNVIIYFDQPTQHQVLTGLAHQLSASGLLFLGRSETLYWLNEILEPVAHSVYRPKRARTAALPETPCLESKRS